MSQSQSNNISTTHKKDTIVFKGIPSSTGLSIAKAYVIKVDLKKGKIKKLAKSKIQSEIARFYQVVAKVKQDLALIVENTQKGYTNIKNIIESSLIILEDSFFLENIEKLIVDGNGCEEAIVQEIEKSKQFFKRSQDYIFRGKSAELDEVRNLLVLTYRNVNIEEDIPNNSIIITQSVNPPQVVKLKDIGVKGIITELGGLGAHSSILCRSFEIPQVIGVNNICEKVSNGDLVIIDGFSGEIIINPSKELTYKYKKRINELKKYKSIIGQYAELPSTTIDGRDIPILANIDLPNEVEAAIVNGTEGVGLVRTESMMLERVTIPNEEEQFEWYSQIAERAFPLSVTFRLFDFGSDKYSEALAINEENPALGLRGVRYLLARPNILRTQIRAILRASKNNNVQVMVPMIAQLEEFLQIKEYFAEEISKLKDEEVDIDKLIKIGTMIETPSAVLIADDLAEVSDFFSIGTNDLIQYTMAADRGNQYVTEIYDFFQPAIIKSINNIVLSAHKKGCKVSICGDIASHPTAISLLIGLGVDSLSVLPAVLLETKMKIRKTSAAETVELAEKILNCSLTKEIRDILYL